MQNELNKLYELYLELIERHGDTAPDIDPDIYTIQNLTREMLRNPDALDLAEQTLKQPVTSERGIKNREFLSRIVAAIKENRKSDKVVHDMHCSFGPNATVEFYVNFVEESLSLV